MSADLVIKGALIFLFTFWAVYGFIIVTGDSYQQPRSGFRAMGHFIACGPICWVAIVWAMLMMGSKK